MACYRCNKLKQPYDHVYPSCPLCEKHGERCRYRDDLTDRHLRPGICCARAAKGRIVLFLKEPKYGMECLRNSDRMKEHLNRIKGQGVYASWGIASELLLTNFYSAESRPRQTEGISFHLYIRWCYYANSPTNSSLKSRVSTTLPCCV